MPLHRPAIRALFADSRPLRAAFSRLQMAELSAHYPSTFMRPSGHADLWFSLLMASVLACVECVDHPRGFLVRHMANFPCPAPYMPISVCCINLYHPIIADNRADDLNHK